MSLVALRTTAKASSNIVASYYMLPADYDESRGIARVADAVQEKHSDLMVREVALLASEKFRTQIRDVLNGRAPRLIGPAGPGAPPPRNTAPAPAPTDTAIINLLTVFMTEDGKIAREIVEQKRAEELQSVYPLPVAENSTTLYSPPYNAYNPPPVSPEIFKVLGLDAGQIGPTGYVIVYRKVLDGRILAPMLPGVVVRYAWPRRLGEPIGGKTSTNASR